MLREMKTINNKMNTSNDNMESIASEMDLADQQELLMERAVENYDKNHEIDKRSKSMALLDDKTKYEAFVSFLF